jgi:glycyl-tRNA synthetase beta subunit
MDGKVRQVAGEKINTADVVRQALEMVNGQALNTAAAVESLKRLGHTNPAQALVERYARESAILAALEKLTGANVTGQIGKWDMSTEEKIHAAFNSYLNRRIAGQHARWSASHK